MTWRPIAFATLGWLAAGLAPLGVHAQAPVVAPSEPTFRITSDLVPVDAIVLRGREPVTGLTADDFELFDNGVPQTIEAITVPGGTHVIVVVDTSASVEGDILRNITRAMDALLRSLAREDRVSLVTFGDRIRILARAAEPGAALRDDFSRITAEGGTALHDAIVVGTALTAADRRPALLVVFTDGADTASWTTATQTLELLRASNVVVCTVGAGLAQLPVSANLRRQRPYFESRTWVAAEASDAPLLLERVAQVTGGSFLRVGRPDALARTFTNIVKRYRQRYILSYAPTGVEPGGWHTIEVRLKGQRGTVQAREGYFR
jgi:Ca-activated chloride channel homolog